MRGQTCHPPWLTGPAAQIERSEFQRAPLTREQLAAGQPSQKIEIVQPGSREADRSMPDFANASPDLPEPQSREVLE